MVWRIWICCVEGEWSNGQFISFHPRIGRIFLLKSIKRFESKAWENGSGQFNAAQPR